MISNKTSLEPTVFTISMSSRTVEHLVFLGKLSGGNLGMSRWHLPNRFIRSLWELCEKHFQKNCIEKTTVFLGGEPHDSSFLSCIGKLYGNITFGLNLEPFSFQLIVWLRSASTKFQTAHPCRYEYIHVFSFMYFHLCAGLVFSCMYMCRIHGNPLLQYMEICKSVESFPTANFMPGSIICKYKWIQYMN